MNNLQKGFIVPVLLVIIALLIIGGGVYVYENKKTEVPISPTTNTQNPPVATQQIPPPANTNPVKSSITIMSPNGREVWAEGSSQTIRWTSKGSDATQSVEIELQRKTSADTQFWYIGTIATNQPGSGSYTWKVSAKDETGKINAGSQYKILIGRNLAKGTGPVDESDNYFTITSNQSVSNGKCGLTITSPLPNSQVSFPLIVKGTIDNSNSQNLGCSWQMFEGIAGTAQFSAYLTEKNSEGNIKGWTYIGNPVFINGANFALTFNFPEGGFGGSPIKIIFTEENPAVIRPALTFELPLMLK